MYAEWLMVLAGVACTFGVTCLVRDLWWHPLQIYKRLEAQGLKGPPFRPIVGNLYELNRLLAEASFTRTNPPSNEIVPYILPYYTAWSKIYGETFVYSTGSQVRLTITDPELIKEILINKCGHFHNLSPSSYRYLLGDGLALSSGEKWARQRRILNLGFHLDNAKATVETMVELSTKMLNDWSRRIMGANQPEGVEIEVLDEYQNLTADIMAHTAFGISYEEGKTVFKLQRRLLLEMAQEAMKSIPLPVGSLLPTAKNLHWWKIRKEIEDNLHQIIRKRRLELESQKEVHRDDLLGVMISAYEGQLPGNMKNLRMTIQDIVDECKTFFFAGYETTASLLTWTTMLLAIHTDWQDRVRAEVINVCGSKHPSSEMINHLKLMGIVLNEALRLYPVNPLVTRCTHRDVNLGKLFLPKGTVLSIMSLVTTHNKQLWGQDADEFNPERFSDGIANASRHPSAFMPFSIGPRICIGQVFALMEAKVVLCKLLQRFSFELSSAYVHAPSQFAVPKPKYGMQIRIKAN